MSRFFISPEVIKGNFAFIVGDEAHHILDVIRLKKGDSVQAFDGKGRLYQGKILDTANKRIKLQIEPIAKDITGTEPEVTLVQALPKKNKMDYILEKCTELGVNSVIPVQTQRTIVRLNKERFHLRYLRWQRIAREAAKQCGRTTIPQIKNLVSWAEALSTLRGFDLKLIASLEAKAKKLKDVLPSRNRVKKIAITLL